MRVALTIAGSDSGGGAGIQADLKTFADHGVHGTCAVCAVTAQDTRGVTRVDAIPVAGIRAQVRAVLDDFEVAAVKVGMLGTADAVHAVAELLEGAGVPLVVDPVMISTTGARLLDADAVRALVEELLPLATVATPNDPELEALGGDAWVAAAGIPVLATGGDAGGAEVVDRLRGGGFDRTWVQPRIAGGPFHGTGCTLSSAIAARLALGAGLEEAVDGAISYVRGLLGGALALGRGVRVLPHGGVS